MRIPTSLLEFQKQFATEHDCVAFLRSRRWKDGFRCPRCGGTDAWQLQARPLDECKACGRQVSLTAGTVFHGTRKPLKVWFAVIAAFLTSKGGCSALELARAYDLNYETAWTWLHKLRALMGRKGVDGLTGLVEVHAIPLTGREDSCAIVAAAEWGDEQRNIGRVRIGIVAALTAGNVATFLQSALRPNAAPFTNGLLIGPGGKCLVPPDSPPRDVKPAQRAFPRAHRTMKLFCRLLAGTYHFGMQPKHLQSYADEFVFRFNRRTSESRFLLFWRLIDSAFRRVPTMDQLCAPPQPLVEA